MDKDIIIQKLKHYTALKEDIVFAYLFGSQAEDKARKNSDIDLGFYLCDINDEDFFKIKLKYKNELEEIFKMPVDVVIMNNAPPILNHQIFANGIIIKNTNPSTLSQFRVRNLYFYQDQMYIINKFLNKTKLRIKEELTNG